MASRIDMDEYVGHGKTGNQGPLSDFIASARALGATHVFVKGTARWGQADAYGIKGTRALFRMLMKHRTVLDLSALYDLTHDDVKSVHPQQVRSELAIKYVYGR